MYRGSFLLFPSVPLPSIPFLCTNTKTNQHHGKHYSFRLTKESKCHLSLGKSLKTHTESLLGFDSAQKASRLAAVKLHGFIQFLTLLLVSINSFFMPFGCTSIFIYKPHYPESYPTDVSTVICSRCWSKNPKLQQRLGCWVWGRTPGAGAVVCTMLLRIRVDPFQQSRKKKTDLPAEDLRPHRLTININYKLGLG